MAATSLADREVYEAEGKGGDSRVPAGAMQRGTPGRKSASPQLPMPVSTSGVMLGEYRVPKGSTNGRPPANRCPSLLVWQGSQSAARVRYSPRAARLAPALPAGTPAGS